MIALPLLALAMFPSSETPAPIAALLRDMPPPDWLQRDLRQTPPASMADTRMVSYAPPPPQARGYMQGLLGWSDVTVKDINLDSNLGGSVTDSDNASMPLLGGAVQRPLRPGKLSLGVEGGFIMGWQGNVQTVVVGGGAIAVSANNDLFLMEGFAGLYADMLLGDKLRVYAGAGGLLDYAHADLNYNDPTFGYINANSDGFGSGVYTRAGFDFPLQSGMRLGFCWRWFDTHINMSGGIDSVELDGMQYMLTFTRSM